MKSILAGILLTFGFITSLMADVSLPKIFSDNMVLQRNAPVIVWGWADKNESISVTLNNKTVKGKADNAGRWQVALPPLQHGGPFEMKITGKKKTINLKNILVGDVWLGSGQSNMEWIVKNSNNPEYEIAKSNYPLIRLFTVKKAMSHEPQKDLAGGEWLECNPKTVAGFSAVAYFFGRKLNQDLNIPIGLINSSWGGTNIQAWISWDVMSKKDEYRGTDISKLAASIKDQESKIRLYEEAMKNEKGMAEKWYENSDPSGWKKISLPQVWEGTAIGNADGYVWFQKDFEVSGPFDASTRFKLSLGPIDDQDQTYLNGKLAGSMNAYNEPRVYNIKPEMVKQGKNTLVIRVLDTGGGGGLFGKPDQLFFQHGEHTIPLSGEWNYKASVLNTDFGIQNTGPNSFPSQLYNAMIAPLTRFAITGMIWYQGESNTWEAYRYRALFPELITDWRNKWKTDFTFLWAQLANFMAADSIPRQSEWAELREAQSMTLSLPKTGEAVLIDIGEADDIHPRNKQDVGLRLALAALKVEYKKDVVSSGPTVKSMEKSGDKIIISFNNTGSGLKIKDKYGYIKGFAIAGEDQKFYWARAVTDGDKIIVSGPSVKNPVAVRYAWGNNPDDANVYNKEGLPAAPFRTDTWPGVSQGQK